MTRMVRDVTDRHGAVAELTALHRVATLVAEGVQPPDLFAVVAEEVSRLVDVSAVSIVRYELDGTASECANVNRGEWRFPVGIRWSLDGTNILRLVRDSAAAARIDDYAGLDGELAAFVRSTGIRSTVGVPIVVAGRLWGAIVGSTTEPVPLPDDTASRLAGFTELLATAIGNAKSREALERLVDEQAALRRVATLVASGVRPDEIFAAVSNEVGRLVGTDSATVVRYDADGEGIIYVGSASKVNAAFPVGAHWKFQEGMASFGVYRTGRSARSGAHLITVLEGPIGETHRRLGIVSAVASPIVVEGRLWGAMAVQSQRPLPLDTEERLEKFTELVATAIANAASKSELAASRMRIVAASDEARRRIERDLHDGTQQRLVVLMLRLAALRKAAPTGEALTAELARVESELASALDELREMSRGIHPSILSEGGLAVALRALARRSTIPVVLDVMTEKRLAEPIEAAAYFVVSEALTNATKHAEASRIDVSLAQRDGALLLSIRDDGVGGATSGQGSGLVGLRDRVEALGGTIRIESPLGAGTLLAVELPLEVEPTG